jgi:hypothetical protein
MLWQRGVDDDIGGDFECRFVVVALAIQSRVPLQGAAYLVLGVDDGPVVVDLDPLLRKKVHGDGLKDVISNRSVACSLAR